MNIAARLYTPAEAAAISDIGVKAVHNSIDKKIVQTASDTAPRLLTADDLLRLKLWYGVGSALSAERRKRLFKELAEKPSAKTIKADDLLIVDLAEARRQIAAKVRDLDEAEADVHSVKGKYTAIMGGQPVFKGTRIPVRLVAAMLEQGADEDEILEGYPSLTRRRLQLARIWVAAHPSRGRRPKTLEELGCRPISRMVVPLAGDPLRPQKRRAAA
jgi:uncharacterized protein (DUF433 family)